jgi:hypothetical protein
MRLCYGPIVRDGWAIDLRDSDVPPAAVVAGVRGSQAADSGDGGSPGPVTVEAPAPGRVHERVGYVRPGMSVSTRSALAAAARSRGYETALDDRLADRRAGLEAIEPSPVSTRAARRAVADAAEETASLRERVAELRGQVQAVRERGGDTGDLEAELAAAASRLSEAETERIAATQRLDRARRQARERREERERRLRLADEVGNLERSVRDRLCDRLEPAYAAAVDAVPGDAPSEPLAAEGVTAALAICRVAALSAPVVLDCDRFDDAEAPARWLDAPVVVL